MIVHGGDGSAAHPSCRWEWGLGWIANRALTVELLIGPWSAKTEIAVVAH